MKRIKTHFGFTLIELLIVVAIIAILAAIAVPNFLEAQVRSKVSRAYADIRSIATGLESYYVDHNVYPNPNINYGAPPAGTKLLARLVQLTTPVAFMTAIPYDPFNPGKDGYSQGAQNVYTYGETNGIGTGTGATLTDTALFLFCVGTEYPDPFGAKWTLFSYGPYMNPLGFEAPNSYFNLPVTHEPIEAYGQTINIGNGQYMGVVYDSTNGTKSMGVVVRVGPQ